jgi:hypothetical protein
MGRTVDEGKSLLWRQRLARYASGGQTVAAFCAAEEVSVPTFYQWKRKLGVDNAERARSERESPVMERRTFVPVRFGSSAQVEIELPNGACVRVPSGDVAALSAAIAAVGRLPTHVAAEASRC